VFVKTNKSALSGEKAPVSITERKDIELKFNWLRSLIVGAGIRGIVALLWHFKQVAEQNEGGLTFNIFENALIEFNIPYVKEDICSIFAGFDLNQDGAIDLNEYINSICGELSQYR